MGSTETHLQRNLESVFNANQVRRRGLLSAVVGAVELGVVGKSSRWRGRQHGTLQ